jgi:hypothetical protein
MKNLLTSKMQKSDSQVESLANEVSKILNYRTILFALLDWRQHGQPLSRITSLLLEPQLFQSRRKRSNLF